MNRPPRTSRLTIFLLAVMACSLGEARADLHGPEQTPQTPAPPPATLVPYRCGTQWGFAKGTGGIVVPCRYFHVDLKVIYESGLTRVSMERPAAEGGGEAWGVVDGHGDEVLPPIYDSVVARRDGIILFRSNGKFGAAAYNGKVIAPLGGEKPSVTHVGPLLWVQRPSESGSLFLTDGSPVDVPLGSGESFSCEEGFVRFFTDQETTGFGLIVEEEARVKRLDSFVEMYGFHAGRALVAIPGGSGSRLYGFIDAKGKPVIALRYDKGDLSGFGADDSKLARVARGTQLGLVDVDGREVTPFRYDYIGKFVNGFAVVGSQRLFGLVDLEGKQVIAPTYSALGFWVVSSSLGEGALGSEDPLLIATYSNRVGIVDTKGHIRVNFDYQEILNEPYWSYAYLASTGFIWARRGRRYGLIARSGREVIEPSYDAVRINHEMWDSAGFPVMRNGRWGFVNRKGVEVIPPQYDEIATEDVGGMIVVRVGRKYGMIDDTGKVLLAVAYDEIRPDTEGFAVVRRDGKYGFASAGVGMITGFEYDDARPFVTYDEGKPSKGSVALVARHGRWGLVNQFGAEIAEPHFERLNVASLQGAPLRFQAVLDGKCGYLNQYGDAITPFEYDDYAAATHDTLSWVFQNERACVSRGGRFGFIDDRGNEVIPLRYDRPASFSGPHSDFALVREAGAPEFIDRDGREFFER